MSERKYIDRKELAQLLEVSVRVIENNEERWNIEQFRADANQRLVRYLRAPLLAHLKAIRIIIENQTKK